MNVIEYVSQQKAPLNSGNYRDEDAAVLSLMAYFRIENLNTDGRLPMTVSRLMEDYLASGSGSDNNRALAAALRDSPRYRNLQVTDFADSFSVRTTEQFAGVTVRMPDGNSVIAFRGTDGTAVGWNEDFLLLSETSVEAQKSAAEYVRRMMEKYPEMNFIITGHSKGGMLANSAAMDAPAEYRDRILRVANFDGPGLTEEAMEGRREAYEELKERMQTYAPEDSVIGQLLTDHEDQIYVKSNNEFIMQHDLFSWEFSEDGFCRGEQTERSQYINSVLDRVVDKIPEGQREALVSAVFLFVTKGNPYGGGDMFKDFKDDINDKRYLDLVADVFDTLHDMTPEEQDAFALFLTETLLTVAKDGYEKIKDTPIIGDAITWGENYIIRSIELLERWMEPLPVLKYAWPAFKELGFRCIRIVREAIHNLREYIYNKTHPYRNFNPGDTIIVDTRHLGDIVNQLNILQGKVVQLDRDLDRLRQDQEWYEVFNKAAIGAIDFLFVGYDRSIRDAIHYLNNVIDMFETYERELLKYAQF